ncbi:hypothetical protein ACFVX6_31560 [Streptomyces sp. NPDC058289]
MRAKVTCKDGINGNTCTVYGPWVGINRWSQVACGSAQRVVVTLVD